jgi:hypothetical protein
LTAPDDADDAFEPSAAVDSVRSSEALQGANVCRAGALSSLLQEATAVMNELVAEQRSLGFSESIIEQGGRAWREVDPFDGQTDFSIPCQWPVGSPRGRSVVFPVGGHWKSPLVARYFPGEGYFSGLTPCPLVAWLSRKLSPEVTTTWAWCSKRSTVAVARVLGMISSKPEGCRLEDTAMARRS